MVNLPQSKVNDIFANHKLALADLFENARVIVIILIRQIYQYMDKRDLFRQDEDDISSQEEAQKQPVQHRNPSQELYQENFNKYVNYLRQFGDKMEEAEEQAFANGIWYVNHPLIEITQVNYQKNVGLFDMIDMEAEQRQMDINCLSVKKIIVAFTFIDNQIEKIIQTLEHDLYDNMLMYGQEAPGKKDPQLPETMTARVLGVYKKVYDLVRKLMAYIQNILLQLHALINKKGVNFKTLTKSFDFSFALNMLGRALRAIYVIDCIVDNNQSIGQHWQAYKKLIKLARNQPQKFGATSSSVRRLQKTMSRLESTILSGNCMVTITEITYDQGFDKTSPLGKIVKNKQLRECFELYFTSRLKEINQSFQSKYQNDEQRKLLQLMCTFALFRRLYPEEEPKDAWRDLWAMQKKVPIIQAHSFACVYICAFMNKVSPLSKKIKADPKDQNTFIGQYVTALEENINIQIVSYYTRFCVWLSRMESVATSNSSLKDVDRKKQKGVSILHERLSNRIYMLCQGLQTILRLSKLLYLCFMLHANQQKPFSKNLIGKLILGIQTLKATAFILKKKSEAFDTMVLTKTIAKDIHIILSPFLQKAKIQQAKRKQNLHKLRLFELIMRLLESPMSELKITYIRYSLGFLGDWIIGDGELHQIKTFLKKLQIIAYNRILIQRFQNCGFLYYVKQLLPSFFQYKRQHPNTCKRLQFLFDGFEDPSFLIKKCPHLANPQELYLEFKHGLLKEFQQNYMVPLKRKLQDFLRISTSAMLIQKLQGLRPASSELFDLVKMVQFEKIRVFDSMIDIRFQISRSFNDSFYNLNVLNMHDMETYEIMRVMGTHIFDLRLHDVFLPTHTIQQNKFDILAIVRNIPQFVAQYKYNLLSQRFLEVTGQGKIIACISIQQLSDSIRTHGLGILSTTVNAFYKFLVTKIMAFNKFLYDDQIQNPLAKDRKWFKQYSDRDDYPGYYPYERAQHVYKEIKKIGKFQDDLNYLDRFRDIITTVGNSLGFIRLLRSASLNTQSKNIQYLPRKVQAVTETFEQIANKSTLSDNSKTACKQLDETLKSFEQKFSDKIDYFNLMIKSFSKIVTKQNKHLKLFYLIIPALSINYVEYVSRGKQQINKKLSSKAFIYDDGFVLGLAYFITLLKQHDHFKTIHWDQAAESYFAQAKNYSKQTVSDTASHSAKFLEELNMQRQLNVKKLEMMEEEFSFFTFNLVSAKVLFKGKAENDSKQVPKSPPSG